jgi:hypothetical protein
MTGNFPPGVSIDVSGGAGGIMVSLYNGGTQYQDVDLLLSGFPDIELAPVAIAVPPNALPSSELAVTYSWRLPAGSYTVSAGSFSCGFTVWTDVVVAARGASAAGEIVTHLPARTVRGSVGRDASRPIAPMLVRNRS